VIIFIYSQTFFSIEASAIQTKFITTGVFFVFIFLFGFWLSRLKKPYHALIFNIHKLIGLALGVFLIANIYQVQKIFPLSLLEILTIAGTMLIYIILVAAGGMLSIQAAGGLPRASQPILTTILAVHQVFPYLAVLSTAVTLYLLRFKFIS
jgi:hypothetical protein